MKTIIEQLTQAGFTNIESDSFGNISFKNGKNETIGLTVIPEMHYKEHELLAIRNRCISMYEKWYCLCNFNEYKRVEDVIGGEYCIMRGNAFSKFCEEVGKI